MSGGNKKPALDEREREKRQKDIDGLYDACVNGKTGIGISHHVQTRTIVITLAQSQRDAR